MPRITIESGTDARLFSNDYAAPVRLLVDDKQVYASGVANPPRFSDHPLVADMDQSSSFNPVILASGGIQVCIHRAACGDMLDGEFPRREEAVLAAGMQYGGYILPAANFVIQDIDVAVNEFGTSRKYALDWEFLHGVEPKFDEVYAGLQHIQQETQDAHPLLYVAHGELAQLSLDQLHKLSAMGVYLWYARYRATPIGLEDPAIIRTLLWQYACPDDGEGCWGEPRMSRYEGNAGADYNRADCNAEELKAGWPFKA